MLPNSLSAFPVVTVRYWLGKGGKNDILMVTKANLFFMAPKLFVKPVINLVFNVLCHV